MLRVVAHELIGTTVAGRQARREPSFACSLLGKHGPTLVIDSAEEPDGKGTRYVAEHYNKDGDLG